MGAALGLEPGEHQKLFDREHSLFPRSALPRWHATFLPVCPGVWRALVRASIILSGFGEGRNNLSGGSVFDCHPEQAFLRSEEPVPSEVEGIQSSRALCS